MLLSSTALRRQPIPRPIAAAYKSLLRPSPVNCRNLHSLPTLAHNDVFRKDGVRGALSPEAFELAWTQYQQFILDKLNRITAGREDEGKSPKDLTIQYARDGARAGLFNYASMAYNNNFFFSGLSPDPQPPPETLKYQIDLAFSSMDSLRDTFIATGNAMFGPGYVWLVAVPNLSGGTSRKLAILNTYNAGTPFPTAHYRLQNKDLATTDMGVRAGENPTQYSSRNGQRHGSFGIHSKSNRESGIWSEPITLLMCISTWQHVWLQDWGVQGKEDYLNAIWNAIDWKAVDKNYGSPEKRTRSS